MTAAAERVWSGVWRSGSRSPAGRPWRSCSSSARRGARSAASCSSGPTRPAGFWRHRRHASSARSPSAGKPRALTHSPGTWSSCRRRSASAVPTRCTRSSRCPDQRRTSSTRARLTCRPTAIAVTTRPPRPTCRSAGAFRNRCGSRWAAAAGSASTARRRRSTGSIPTRRRTRFAGSSPPGTPRSGSATTASGH